ncbi:uncharacterized protein LOC117670025 isoform X2 [Pantherophis guttatus]|nr:uncharacterized protein LOC117670025 isoform X2 [Pantherophis guttatus]XP_060549444.1 uncharacterized protein LOC117670025 isoform X2 [Pantherophis guttatus]
MAEAKLSEESLLQETGGAEAVVIPANLENTKVQLSPPSLPAELQAKKREADKYPGTVPKALEAEFPFANVKDKEKPLSELGRASWGWEWQRSPDKAAPPHPRMRDEAERLNAMIEQYLRCYIDYQQSNWADLLSFAEVAYNNAVHSSTGLTPFKIVSGMDFVPMPEYPREPPFSVSLTDWMAMLRQTWENVKRALAKAAQSYKEQADKHRTPQRPFQLGEKVYLSTKYLRLRLPSRKLGPKFIGPFPIIKIINPVTVQLQLPRLLGKIHPVFHSSLLKPVVGSTLRPTPREPPGPLVVGGQTHYEVQRILDSRWHRGRLQYLIKWKGYPLSEASWVKSANIQADRLIAKFHADHPGKPGGGGAQPGRG